MAAHDALRRYFPGDVYAPRPTPLFIITVTLVPLGGGPPRTEVLPSRTLLDAEARADLVKLDILKMAYKEALPLNHVLTHQDELFEELQQSQHVVVQVHETVLPPGLFF
jgi:hypothetical protein